MIFIVILFTVSILFGAVGALLMKIGAEQMGVIQLDTAQAVLGFVGKMFTSVTILGGMTMYFLSAVTWLYLLTKLEVSVVQPILALTYIATPILAIVFIGEKVPPARWLGIVVIVIGVFLVARTST